jgi:hypothetical protein
LLSINCNDRRRVWDMVQEYDTFVDDPTSLRMGEEIEIAIRELTPENRRMKYRTHYVRAIVDSPKEGVDILMLRWQRGRLYPEKFSIKIIEKVGDLMPKKTVVRT